ncbi:glycosyltransferase family 4 protein [Caballeronia telluris]|uniref:Group 1 glycosyl transferase n=1 Tax=Caballeronia telluris TaxID=326475 RepID=A0A158IZH4_9BURK|nr:glycosyltransferase family 4 protein [Caballeronia telluris]SAL61490.1 group 1 glycosyl transferase [Caballeronia telluris]
MNAPALKVAFVSHSAAPAGAERSLVNFVSNLPSSIAPIVIFPSAGGPMFDQIVQARLPAIKLEYDPYLPSVGDTGGMREREERKQLEQRRFSTLCKELEIDAVVVNTNVISPAVYAAASLEIPVIIHSHGLISQRLLSRLNSQLWAFEDPAQLLSASRVICPSQIVADFYVDFYGVPRDAIEVVPNGTLFEPWAPLPFADASAGAPNKFVMLCTLDVNKNVPMFIEAARIARERGLRNFEFHVYGHGAENYHDHLRDLIWTKRLDDTVFLHDKTLDVKSVYDGATGVVVASQLESFSFVTIEAMSRGRAVVSTRCGGPEQLINDGETGFLVDRNDAEGLAERIRVLATDRALASRMGAEGRRIAETRYEIGALSAHYAELIAKVVKESSHQSLRSKRLIAMRHTGLKRAVTMMNGSFDASISSLRVPVVDPALSAQAFDNRARAIEFANHYSRSQSGLLARVRHRLRARENLWSLVSEDFQPLRQFSEQKGLHEGARLTLSHDLRRVAYREYTTGSIDADFRKVLIGVSMAALGMGGTVGIELVDSRGNIVAHQECQLADASPYAPVSFDLGSGWKTADSVYRLRIFARECDGPVWAYEFVEDRLGGFLSPGFRPFFALT